MRISDWSSDVCSSDLPHDVRDVVLGADGVLDSADAGTVLIDMTTSDPTLAEEIASAATGKGVSSLDAPVSGGDLGARNAALTIMVGGDAAAFESARPLFDLMRSEEHTSELQSLMRISYAVFCLKKKKQTPLRTD